MRTRTWIVLALALASGVIAGYAALQLISGQPTVQTEVPRSSFSVVVASRDLAVGSMLGAADLQTVDWPGDAVPEGYANAVSDVVGRGLVQAVKRNEPVLMSKLADRGAGAGLPILIPEGMRAIPVRVDEIVSVGGWVTPGTRVDVMVTMQQPGGTEFITKTILQNVEVGSAGREIRQNALGEPVTATSVTLFLSPDDGEALTLAARQGQISFALRNPMDVRESRTAGARLSRLLTMGVVPTVTSRPRSAPATTATEETGSTLEVIKGGRSSIVRFGTGGNLE
jgi:pilus assembly protein CpaB